MENSRDGGTLYKSSCQLQHHFRDSIPLSGLYQYLQKHISFRSTNRLFIFSQAQFLQFISFQVISSSSRNKSSSYEVIHRRFPPSLYLRSDLCLPCQVPADHRILCFHNCRCSLREPGTSADRPGRRPGFLDRQGDYNLLSSSSGRRRKLPSRHPDSFSRR